MGNEIEVWEVDEGGHFVGCAGGASLNKHESKHHLAMLRLGVEGRTKAHEVLWAIEDLIGPCKRWPLPRGWTGTRKDFFCYFWLPKLNDNNLLKYVTFCTGNDLPAHLLLQWLDVRGVSYDNKKVHGHLKRARANMALKDPTKCKQFYWDLAEQEYCLMTGHPSNNVNGAHVPKPRKETYGYLWAPYDFGHSL